MANCANSAMHVLIVHFNTPELTSQLVREFPRRTPRGRTIWMHVLDNGSRPENLEKLRKSIEELPAVTLRVSNENIGFGEGVNLLSKASDIDDLDILWILNPDTQLQSGCLELLEEELDSGVFAVVSPLIYSGDGANAWIWYCGGFINTRKFRVFIQFAGCGLAEAPPRSFETEFVTGAAPMMRASTFRGIGGFPARYFLYWEDAFFSWKARDIGFTLGVVPAAHLWHHVGGSLGGRRSQAFYYWNARNRIKFASDIGVPRRRFLYGPGGLESLRLVARALFVEQEGRLSKARAAIRGTVRGLGPRH